MKTNHFFTFLILLAPICSYGFESAYVHSSTVFEIQYPEPLKQIQQAVEEFNKTHVNRILHVVINYNQTELSPREIQLQLEKEKKTTFEGINLDEADTVDILFFTSRTYFQLDEDDSLILLKDYYFNPISTHLSRHPDAHEVLGKARDMGLVEYVRSYLNAIGGAVQINTEMPSFDPITITSFDKIPVSRGVDGQGNCSFEISGGGINLQLIDGQNRLASMDVPTGVDIYYKTNCSENKLLSARFLLTKGLQHVVTIGPYRMEIQQFELILNEKRELNGTIRFQLKQAEDLKISDLLILKKGLQAALTFSYEEGAGQLTWGQVSGLSLDLQKSGQVIGSFSQSGEISQNGSLEGTFRQHQTAKINTSLAGLTFTNLALQARLNLLEGSFVPLSGGFSVSVENVRGFDESRFSCDLTYDEKDELFHASVEDIELSTFGISLDKIKKKDKVRALQAAFTPDFSLKRLEGGFTISHDSLRKNNLTVHKFLFEDGRIRELNMSGRAGYSIFDFKLLESRFDEEKEMIIAKMSGESTESKAEAEVFFYKDGSIHVPDINFDLELPAFGPIAARLHGGYSMSDVEMLEDHYHRFEDIGLDFTLKTEGEEIEIIKSSASFELHRETNEYRNVVIDLKLESPAEKRVTLSTIEMAPEEIHLEVNEKGELSGYVDFSGEVSRPIDLIGEKLKLVDGRGQFRYVFEGKKSFEGHLELEKMENIKAVYLKKKDAFGMQPLLMLSDGAANRDRLTGTFTLPESGGGRYSSNGFEVNIKNISASVNITNYQAFLATEPTNRTPEIQFISGNGEVEVSKIQGLEGELSGEITFENDSIKVNFGSTKSLAVNGFELDSIRLNAIFNHDFDLLNISGGMRAKHEKLKSKLKVTHFEVKDGSLEALRLKGRSQLKGVEVYVKDAFYHKDRQTIELSAGIKFPVKPHQDYDEMSEIGVKDFIMNFEGTINQLGFYADIDADPLEIKIDGSYKENDYHIKFSTIVFDAEVNGEVALGSRYSSKYGVYYNYFYLQGSGDGNGNGIPLGPTGIMLSRLGGEFGYNFNVDLIKKIKSPQYLTYTAGAELGISIAKTLQVDGRANLTISPEKLQMALGATLEIPPSSDPYIRAMGDIAYEIDYSGRPYTETVKGTLNTRVRIPKESGNIFKMDSEVELNIADDRWKISSNKAFNGKIFNEIDFNGQLSLQGSTKDNSSFSGELEGNMRYSWGLNYENSLFENYLVIKAKVDVLLYGGIKSIIKTEIVDNQIVGCAGGKAKLILKNRLSQEEKKGEIGVFGVGKYSQKNNEKSIDFHGELNVDIKPWFDNEYFSKKFSYFITKNELTWSSNFEADGITLSNCITKEKIRLQDE